MTATRRMEHRAGGRAFNPQHGFTLLEVMVAVAILAMVVVTLMGVKSRSIQDVAFAEHMTTATLLAKRMMTETLVSAPAGTTAEAEEEGEFQEEEFKEYTWKKTRTVIATPVQDLSVTEVRVAVLWTEGNRPEMVELVRYE